MKSIFQYIVVILLSAAASSCEKVIDLDLPKGEALPYVDAWITNKPGLQSIKFLKAVNYMSAQGPEPVTDAQIMVTDITSSQNYTFNYSNGAYSYDAGNTPIGIVGHAYRLRIIYKGETFEATDTLKRVNTIDSLTYEFKKEENDEKEGYYAKLYARDLAGARDYYWIRTYRNNELNHYVGEMLSIDGAFGEEGITDGFVFIPPFRDGITSGEKPYQKGDNLKVVIRSLSRNGFYFLEQAVKQMTNQGMFAEVLQNVPANVKNLQAGSSTKIYGWFGTVAETELSKQIQ
jgi:hypothetical protein